MRLTLALLALLTLTACGPVHPLTLSTRPPCDAPEPPRAHALMRATQAANVETWLAQWSDATRPPAVTAAELFARVHGVTGVDWFGSCQASSGETISFYVLHAASGDVPGVVVTDGEGKVEGLE